MEMAVEHPSCSFTGVDLNDFQPRTTRPKNTTFTTLDILQRTTFADQSFDYIHVSKMSTCIPVREWPYLLAELYRILRPGGILEVFDTCGDYENAGEMYIDYWYPNRMQLLYQMGLDYNFVQMIGQYLTRVGFHSIQQTDILMPVGPWGGTAGKAAMHVAEKLLHASKWRMLQHGMITREQEANEAIRVRIDELSEGREAIAWNVFVCTR
jgi:ubiquinone/menaquinone biosynthesis C-methylase UbiE